MAIVKQILMKFLKKHELWFNTHISLIIISNYNESFYLCPNRPFPNSLVPLFQNESKGETFHSEMSSACSILFLQIKVIFIKMV